MNLRPFKNKKVNEYMNHVYRFLFIVLLVLGAYTMSYSTHFIPANNSFIQYYGRWDMTDSLHPRHSWPGVYLSAEFSGTSIGIRMRDSANYYNVYIDGKFLKVLHGTITGEADYLLADSLANTHHTLLFSKRNIMFDAVFSVSGLLLDEGAALFPPPAKPERKIEFIGDSFTVGSANEWTSPAPAPNDSYTNTYKSFGPMIARNSPFLILRLMSERTGTSRLPSR